MLLAEHRVLPLERLQPLDLPAAPPFNDPPPGSALEDPVPRFFSPARQHEGMDIQGIGYRLHLHPRHPAELHRRQLEVHAVAMNLLRADRPTHSTPPSVSRKCLLYRGRFSRDAVVR